MQPERLRGEEYNAYADVFSLGVTLYEVRLHPDLRLLRLLRLRKRNSRTRTRWHFLSTLASILCAARDRDVSLSVDTEGVSHDYTLYSIVLYSTVLLCTFLLCLWLYKIFNHMQWGNACECENTSWTFRVQYSPYNEYVLYFSLLFTVAQLHYASHSYIGTTSILLVYCSYVLYSNLQCVYTSTVPVYTLYTVNHMNTVVTP